MIQKFCELSIMYRYGKIRREAKIAYKTKEGARREMNRQFEKFLKEYNITLDNSTTLDKDEDSISLYHKEDYTIIFSALLFENQRFPIHEDDEEISEIGGTLYKVAGHPDIIIRLYNEATIGKDWAYQVLQGDPNLIKGNNVIKLTHEEETVFLNNKGG